MLCNGSVIVSVQGEGAFGDPRRPNHYGQSDRHGIVNKSRKVFSKEELANMLKHINDDGPAPDKIHYLEDLSSDDKSMLHTLITSIAG